MGMGAEMGGRPPSRTGTGPTRAARAGTGRPRTGRTAIGTRQDVWTGLRRWRRRLARHRRWLAAGTAAAAATVALQASAPAPAPTEQITVAARDLPAGHVLTDTDLVTVRWPRGIRPDGALTSPHGRVLAGALRRGEPVTDARLTGPGLLAGQPPGTVAVTVRLTDPAGLAMASTGRPIQLLGGPGADSTAGAGQGTPGEADGVPAAGRAELLAADALVLAVPAPTDAGAADGQPGGGLLSTATAGAVAAGGQSGSGVLIVAVDADTAARLVAAAGTRTISVAVVQP
jgi:hypothetical protein